MRNKKNDANGFYLCISDLVVDGVLMCGLRMLVMGDSM